MASVMGVTVSTGSLVLICAAAVQEVWTTTSMMAAVVVSILLALVHWRWTSNLPPGPTGLPLLGSLHKLGALPHRSLAKLAKTYGPLMSLRLGQSQYIVASSPEVALEFLKIQDANFAARPPLRAGQVMFGHDVLFQNNSPLWRQLKKMFVVGLTGNKRLEATRHVRQEEVALLLRTLPHDCEFNLRKHLSMLVTGIITRLVLNRSLGEHSITSQEPVQRVQQVQEVKSFQRIMVSTFKCLSAFYAADFIPVFQWLPAVKRIDRRFHDNQKRMDGFATGVIAEHQARRSQGPIAEHEKDMVHLLLDEMDEWNSASSRPEGAPLINMANVKGVMWDAFSGGTDTILFSCEWIMSEIVSNPSVQAAAQAELDRVVGPHRRVQESDLPGLRYIQAVVKEALRLHPIAPLMAPHQAIGACQAFGFDIPASTRLLVNVWAIGRDPAVWVDPLQFQPERWLDLQVVPKGAYLPFGAGRRMCPGMAMADVTLQFCVASLLHAFTWSTTKDCGMAEWPGMGVPRAVPLRVIATPRLPESPELYC